MAGAQAGRLGFARVARKLNKDSASTNGYYHLTIALWAK